MWREHRVLRIAKTGYGRLPAARKTALPAVIVLSAGCFLYAGGFGLGMTGAVKNKTKELDRKVLARAAAPAADTAAPLISGISAGAFSSSATVAWTTDEPSTSRVEYGPSVSYGSSTVENAGLVTGHSVAVTGLNFSTTYYYRVISRDAYGNTATGGQASFATRDQNPPALSNIQAVNVFVTSATILWQTDEPATGQVEFGTSAGYGSFSSVSGGLNTSHSVLLAVLPNRTYHYRVRSADQSSNLSVGPDGTFTTRTSTVAFTYPLVALSTITMIEPLGHMLPAGHTFPTDHIYLSVNTSSPPVYAIADGVIRVIGMVQGEETYGLHLYFTDTFYANIGHISVLDPVIAAQVGYLANPYTFNEVNVPVTAGQVLGYGWAMTGPEIGLINYGVATSFIDPSKYAPRYAFCDSVLKYYEEPLRTQLYALVNRTGSDKDGRVDYDIPGRLIGNWFLEGADPTADSSHLAIVYDNIVSTKVAVSVGGTLSIGVELYAVTGNTPDPAGVSQAAGKVSYELTDFHHPYTKRGMLIVELAADDRIRIETFPGSTNPNEAFTAGARYYTR